MKIQREAQAALSEGFAAIIRQFQLEPEFAAKVDEEANRSIEESKKQFVSHRLNLTSFPFITLDPATSTDLDQAFFLEQDGRWIVLHYALADLEDFVPLGGAVEGEAWQRGVTIYGISGKIPLYPKSISQQAASLLPDGVRPAVRVVVAIAPDGSIELRSVDRIYCHSQAKLAYDAFDVHSMPLLEQYAERMWANDRQRGAVRVDTPQQEVVTDASAPGGVRLALKGKIYSESVNSALSLSVNMALGTLLSAAKVGVFRVMPSPEPQAIGRLRRQAKAMGLLWPESQSLVELQRTLNPYDSLHQRFLLEARRSGGRASYATFREGSIPWHSAIAATYVHATAPMRRLADRYCLDLANAISNRRPVHDTLHSAIDKLPAVMEAAEQRASNVDRAVIDLLEAVSLQHRIGEVLEAEIIDAKAGVIQTVDLAIRSRAANLVDPKDGDRVHVRIAEADPKNRRIRLVVCPTPS
jgi:exoribonuclease R